MADPDLGDGFHPGHNPWAIALTVTIATFMEVMDTSIANVSLPHIAGGLSAGQDESTWVLTSYLVSNAIVLPISAWLSERFGRKRFYMSCVALFTLSSFLCGLAPSLGLLVFFRILQGIGGGGLGPSEQAILADTFPASKRGMAFAVYGMAVVLAPAIGPTLGGWITDNFSWRWIFYVNVPFGIASLFLANIMVKDPPHMVKKQQENRKSPIDFTGMVLVATGLGALQLVMDKGQRDDWFGSTFITVCFGVAVVGIVAFIFWEWNHKHPIMNLKLFKNPNFAVTNTLMLLLGVALFGSTVVIPQFLQLELGYTAQSAGEVLTPGGFAILLLMPLVGFLVSRVDARYLIAFGFTVTALALFHMTNLYLGIDFRTAVLWRVYQALGLAFMFVPINTVSYVGIPPEESNQVSAMSNLMRNIGGSIGISAVTSLLARSQQIHQVYLAGRVNAGNPQVQSLLDQSSRLFASRGPTQATQLGYVQISQVVQKQAAVLAYIDTFWIMGALSLSGLLFVFFLKKNKPGAAPAAH